MTDYELFLHRIERAAARLRRQRMVTRIAVWVAVILGGAGLGLVLGLAGGV